MMGRALTWMWLLVKRLYKRPVFLALLLLIPMLTLAYSAVSREQSGVVTIALACEDPEDALALEIMDSLQAQTKLVRYLRAKTPTEAEALVRGQYADGAWIFPAELASHIRAYAAGESGGGFIRVVEEEGAQTLTLAREVLSGLVYGSTARAYFIYHLRQSYPALDDLTDEQLLAYFEATEGAGELFVFTTLGAELPETVTYLTAPLRGMLAAAVTLCALAGAMFYRTDLEEGRFLWLPKKYAALVELASQLIAAIHAQSACLIALWAAGLTVAPLRELALFLLTVLASAFFGALLRVLCPSQRAFAVVLPVLAVLLLVACPVFLRLESLQMVAHLLPPTYSILGAYDPAYLGWFALYDAILAGAYFLGKKLLRR